MARNNHHSQPRHLTKHGTRQGITVIVQDTTYIRQEELEPTRPEHFAAAELKRSNAKFPATFLSHSPSLWPSPPLSLYLAHSETHILSLLLLSSSTRTRFYPQRCSGQAVVTGVIPSTPRYAPSIYRAYGSAFPLLVDFHRMSLTTHALALSVINNLSLIHI